MWWKSAENRRRNPILFQLQPSGKHDESKMRDLIAGRHETTKASTPSLRSISTAKSFSSWRNKVRTGSAILQGQRGGNKPRQAIQRVRVCAIDQRDETQLNVPRLGNTSWSATVICLFRSSRASGIEPDSVMGLYTRIQPLTCLCSTLKQPQNYWHPL